MDKAPERNFMKFIGLGKGKGLAYKASQALAQRIVPAFNMGSLPCFFAYSTQRVPVVSAQMTKNLVIGLPKITKGGAMTISPW